MNDDVLHILMYLYDNFLCDARQATQEISAGELEKLGFMPGEIAKAFDWLEEVTKESSFEEIIAKPSSNSLRLYCPVECEKLNVSCRGFLQFLEHANIIDPSTREMIISQVMQLQSEELNVAQFVRIILIVLLTHTGHEGAITWLEHYLNQIPVEESF